MNDPRTSEELAVSAHAGRASEAVQVAVAGTALAGSLHFVGETGSTNTLALEAAQRGAASGVWVADRQTGGRGRGGHAWHSPPGAGLYASVLLRPRLPVADVLKLALAAGLAVRRALVAASGGSARAALEAALDLRWPNDILLGGQGTGEVARKVGGILIESAIAGASSSAAAGEQASGGPFPSYAIVGIGLNLNQQDFPPELAGLATSIRLLTGEPCERDRVLASLLPALLDEVDLLEREVAGSQSAMPLALRFEQASTWVRGLAVEVAEEGGYTGVTDGLDPRGLLRVHTAGGLRLVRHGGVRAR